MKEERKTHESYGMINVSKFNANNAQFFGSDLFHNGGMSITISRADKTRKYSNEWYYAHTDIIRIRLTSSQFIDAITSGMNTQGVPCTIERLNGESVPQIDHVEDKKHQFSTEMKETQLEFINKINKITELLDGNLGKKKVEEIKLSLRVLKDHISSNTNFVMDQFDEAMEKTVTEAKQSVSNYIDNKIHAYGLEGLRNELNVSLEKTDESQKAIE